MKRLIHNSAAVGRGGVSPRAGIATLWLILGLPVFITLFALIVEIGNIWLARVELKNALDASSLAAVKTWAEQGGSDTLFPREVGVEFAFANIVGGSPLLIQTNYGPGAPPPPNPNQNLSCDGDLIFGAIDTTDMNNIIFNAGIRPSCCDGIRINAFKEASSASTYGRQIGIFYESGSAPICSASFRLPQNPVRRPNQQPYWDLNAGDVPGRSPQVSNYDTPDFLNLNNSSPTPYDPFYGGDSTLDARGLDPDPVLFSGSTPETSDYRCPGNSFPPPFLGNGDVCFTFEDPIDPINLPGRYQVLTIHFREGSFEPPSDPNDPNTIEFVRFGASMNQLEPPAFPPGGDNNDGDKMGITGVSIIVRFCNGDFCEGRFIDDGVNNGFSPSTFSGSGGGGGGVGGGGNGGGSGSANNFGVRAQATIEVPSTLCELFGFPLGPYTINACSDAMYRCEDCTPRLVHISTFICPGP